MKKVLFTFLVGSFCFLSNAQKKEQILVTIDNEKVTVDEFKRIYEKNLNMIDDDAAKDIKNNLDLYINYKLKVKNAYQNKLDTLPSYKREIETYKNQLIAPYLQDTVFLKKMIKEAYFRTANEVKASHILIKVSENAKPKDTLKAYNKIIEARTKIVNGASFDSIAKLVSEDPSAKTNGGDLGYFGAFKMIYNFEEKAFNTKIGEVSQPFRTRFGYHIVKPVALRKSKGQLEAAHIYLNNDVKNGKQRIDSIYTKLKNGASFADLAKEYSTDNGSKNNGGKLRKFGAGQMVKPFEDVAFSLEDEGDYSKPIKTRFGWHIIKLIKKHPVQSFEELKPEIEDQLKRNGRAKLSDDAVINKLKNEYNIDENEALKAVIFEKGKVGKDSLQKVLFSINDKKIKLEDFAKYKRNRRQYTNDKLYNLFLDNEVKEYFKENLVYTEPEYAATLKEYQDGLLLFELMQQKIWDKSSKDSIGLQNYYEKNQQWYDSYSLEPVKGQVINDYQNELEENWITALRAKSAIEIKKKALRKLVAYYEEKK